jgi:TPR repeat protein
VRATGVQQSSISFLELQNLSRIQLKEKLAGEPEEAARWLEAAAKYGLVEAQTAFAQVLLDGRGVQHDARAAASWFTIAAGAGYTPAINMLGRCCEHGWGMAIDLPRAADCYRRAAEAGLDWGEYNYANLLLRGRGVDKDRATAFALYRRAATQNHAKSINMVGRFLEEGWETAVDFAAAADCYRRAAEAGDFRGQYNLASVLARGGDIAQAECWLHRAMETATAEFLSVMAARLANSPEPSLRRISALAAERAARI